MREIKFRGMRKDNGEWITGDLTTHYIPRKVFICNLDNMENHIQYLFEVDPETVGQFTGLTDKNGKEVYEGDVLQVWRSVGKNSELRGKYHIPMEVTYCPTWCQFVLVDKDNKDQFGIWQSFEAFEVIGNIHDKDKAAVCKTATQAQGK